MPENNLISVGAVVDLGTYKAGMQDAVATTEATTQEMSASFEKLNTNTHEAMAGMAFAAEDSGLKISRHFRSMLAEIPIVNAAFSAIMPVLAFQVGLDILEQIPDKLHAIEDRWAGITKETKLALDRQEQYFLKELDFQAQLEGKQAHESEAGLQGIRRQHEQIDNYAREAGQLRGLADLLAVAKEAQGELGDKAVSEAQRMADANNAVLRIVDTLKDAGHDIGPPPLLNEKGSFDTFKKSADEFLQKAIEKSQEFRDKAEEIEKVTLPNLKAALTQAATDKSVGINIANIDAAKKQTDEIVQMQRNAIQALHVDKVISDEQALELSKANIATQYQQDEAALQAKLAQLKRDPDRNTTAIIAVQGEIQSLRAQHLAALEKLNGDYNREVEKNGQEAVSKAAERDNNILQNLRGALDARMKAVKEQSDSEVQLEELAVQNKFNLGKISKQQEIAQLAALKIEELQVDIRYLQNRQQLYVKGSKEYEQIEAAITKDKLQQTKLRTKADTDEANNFSAQIKRQLKDWQSLNQQLSQSFMQTMNSFNSSLSSFIVEGQANWKQLAATAIENIISIALQYEESKLLMSLFDKLGAKTKLDSDVETGLAQVEIAANVGAANAYAAWADMPAIAAGMAAAAAGIIHGFAAPIAATAVKWDIGTNFVPMDGLAYLHRGEKVIPASERGSGYTGGSHTFNFHYNVMGSVTGHIADKEHNAFKNMITRELGKMGIKRK